MAKLAEKAGIADSYICRLETGVKTNPSMNTIESLSKALDVTITELITETEVGENDT